MVYYVLYVLHKMALQCGLGYHNQYSGYEIPTWRHILFSLLAYSSLVKNGDENEVGDENKVSDVHALLAQKEKDLILAAELGKALLEKNEDLSQHNEKMAEDFSKQLEVSLEDFRGLCQYDAFTLLQMKIRTY